MQTGRVISVVLAAWWITLHHVLKEWVDLQDIKNISKQHDCKYIVFYLMRTVYLKEDGKAAEASAELSTGFLEAGCVIITFLRWVKFQPSQSRVEAGKKVVVWCQSHTWSSRELSEQWPTPQSQPLKSQHLPCLTVLVLLFSILQTWCAPVVNVCEDTACTPSLFL